MARVFFALACVAAGLSAGCGTFSPGREATENRRTDGTLNESETFGKAGTGQRQTGAKGAGFEASYERRDWAVAKSGGSRGGK